MHCQIEPAVSAIRVKTVFGCAEGITNSGLPLTWEKERTPGWRGCWNDIPIWPYMRIPFWKGITSRMTGAAVTEKLSFPAYYPKKQEEGNV